MKRRELLLGAGAAGLLAACGGDEGRNAYRQVNLVADDACAAAFAPALRAVKQSAEFINAWGIAIRPAGAGGHFWVGAGAYSYQFIGDVTASPDATLRMLFQDALAIVAVPGAGGGAGFTTGVVFNGAPLAGDKFVVSGQTVNVDGQQHTLSGSARFLFATDSGVISGWTERDATTGAIVRRDGSAVAAIDERASGAAFFGLALKPGSWDRLWAADFGTQPQIRIYDAAWQPLAAGSAFANPFIGSRPRAEPGDYVPFNIQVLSWRGADYAFVAYAKSQPDPDDPSRFFAGEEDAIDASLEGSRPDRGRVAMFDLEGRLVKIFADDGRLNAPWGLAVAPDGFGALSGALLVGNFGGAGRIAAFDIERGRFVDFLRRPDGLPVAIAGLWGLQFGNGASLGDSKALYFAAGPGDETQGLFGALRPVED